MCKHLLDTNATVRAFAGQLTGSQNCRVDMRNRLVVIEKRSIFATQVFVRFLNRLWCCQEMMVDHMPDLNRYCPEERAVALKFWTGGAFYWIYLHTTLLDNSERPKHVWRNEGTYFRHVPVSDDGSMVASTWRRLPTTAIVKSEIEPVSHSEREGKVYRHFEHRLLR